MLKELVTLLRLHRLVVVNVSPQVPRDSIKLMLVLKCHVYEADALQIASAKKANSKVVVTGDRG